MVGHRGFAGLARRPGVRFDCEDDFVFSEMARFGQRLPALQQHGLIAQLAPRSAEGLLNARREIRFDLHEPGPGPGAVHWIYRRGRAAAVDKRVMKSSPETAPSGQAAPRYAPGIPGWLAPARPSAAGNSAGRKQ